jgi:hypothetical protein
LGSAPRPRTAAAVGGSEVGELIDRSPRTMGWVPRLGVARVAPWSRRSPAQPVVTGVLPGMVEGVVAEGMESRESLAVRTPPAVSSIGVRALATWSQLSRVLAGRPGVPISKLAVSGRRTSGRSPVRAISLSPEAAVGGQLQRMSWKAWKRVLGDEIGAAQATDLGVELDGAGVEGTVNLGGESELAAEVGVAAEDDQTGLAQRGVTPAAGEIEGHLGEALGAAEGAFELEGAGVGGAGVGAGGNAGEAEMPLAGGRKPEREVGFGEGEGELLLAGDA